MKKSVIGFISIVVWALIIMAFWKKFEYVQAQDTCPQYKIVSPLEEQPQEWVDWCTVAASRVVTHHYGQPKSPSSGLPKSQCELVGDVVRKSCCLGNFFDQACHPNPIWPHDVFAANTVNFTYKPLDYIVIPPTGPPSWSQIVAEICNHNRPLLSVASVLDISNWHAVVVEGYRIEDTGWQKVRVFDPQEDLCDSPSCTDQNPRFFSYDSFFLSGFDHHTDYIEIAPNTDNVPPASPHNFTVQ